MAIDPELLEAMRAQRVPRWQFVTNVICTIAFWGGLARLQSGQVDAQFLVPIAVVCLAGLAGLVLVFWAQARREDELGASMQRDAAQLAFWVVMALLAVITVGQAIGWIGPTIDGDPPSYFVLFMGLLSYVLAHVRAWRRRVGA